MPCGIPSEPIKIYSDVDLWVHEKSGRNQEMGKMDRLKSEIEQRFFNISPSRTILNHGGNIFLGLRLEQRFSTASSYEDALKSLIKFRRYLKGMTDTKIKTLYEIKEDKLVPLDEFKDLDMGNQGYRLWFCPRTLKPI